MFPKAGAPLRIRGIEGASARPIFLPISLSWNVLLAPLPLPLNLSGCVLVRLLCTWGSKPDVSGTTVRMLPEYADHHSKIKGYLQDT